MGECSALGEKRIDADGASCWQGPRLGLGFGV